jgi:hypothetical protein
MVTRIYSDLMDGRRQDTNGDPFEWSDSKLSHAGDIAEEIARQALEWQESGGIVGYLAPDPAGTTSRDFEVRVSIARAPNFVELALLFGDFLHNLRSALDAFVWNLATLDGAEPSHPHRVQFPIYDRKSSWPAAASNLSTVPIEVLEFIESTQPFTQEPSESRRHQLALLATLSNGDKHRGLFVSRLAGFAVTAETEGLIARFDDDDDPDGPVAFEAKEASELVDGALVGIVRLPGALLDPKSLTVTLHTALALDIDGRTYVLADLLGGLWLGASNIIEGMKASMPQTQHST